MNSCTDRGILKVIENLYRINLGKDTLQENLKFIADALGGKG